MQRVSLIVTNPQRIFTLLPSPSDLPGFLESFSYSSCASGPQFLFWVTLTPLNLVSFSSRQLFSVKTSDPPSPSTCATPNGYPSGPLKYFACCACICSWEKPHHIPCPFRDISQFIFQAIFWWGKFLQFSVIFDILRVYKYNIYQFVTFNMHIYVWLSWSLRQ